jgi:hypothetical protein
VDERKEDRRLPVEAQRERWAENVLKRKGIGIAVGECRGNQFANRLAGRRSVGAKAQHGEPGDHEIMIARILYTVKLYNRVVS